MDKYFANPSKLKLDEIRTIYTTISKMYDCLSRPNTNPLSLLESNLKRFEDNGIKISIEEVKKLSKEEQSKILKDAFKKLNEKKVFNIYDIDTTYADETIYHEMGHLQDFGKNLKDLYMKTYNDFDLNAIADRFGSIMSNENMKKLWETDKETFKKQFPNQYEFLTSTETQKLAGRISQYAQSGIGEFIAEYYAQMARAKQYGGKMAEDIDVLYKKYNGTTI